MRVRWVVNPVPDAGPGSSLRCGLAALPTDLPLLLVTLGDLPLLEAADVQTVAQAWHARPPGVELVLPQHAGQPGHPIALGAAVREAVMRANDGEGVREWRRAHPARVQFIEVAHARCTTDVDTPADLERLRRTYGVALEWPEAAR
jgi:CTP:molybdopterin cytidylyltransferase MocA